LLNSLKYPLLANLSTFVPGIVTEVMVYYSTWFERNGTSRSSLEVSENPRSESCDAILDLFLVMAPKLTYKES